MTQYIVIAVVIGMLALGITVQTKRLETAKAEYAAFVAAVKAKGDEQERKTKEQITKDKAAQEKANAENQTSRARIAALSRQLRNARASSGILPAPAPTARRPDAITFDRPELERTLQRLDDGVSAVVAEGDQARVDLHTAMKWATELRAR